MPISFQCPRCGVKINAPDKAAGRQVTCPRDACGQVMIVPQPDSHQGSTQSPPPFDFNDTENTIDHRTGRSTSHPSSKIWWIAGASVVAVALAGLLLVLAGGNSEEHTGSAEADTARGFLETELEAKKFSQDHTLTALPAKYFFARLISYRITSFRTEEAADDGSDSYLADLTVELELQGVAAAAGEGDPFGGGPTVTRHFVVRISHGGVQNSGEPFWVATVIRGD